MPQRKYKTEEQRRIRSQIYYLKRKQQRYYEAWHIIESQIHMLNRKIDNKYPIYTQQKWRKKK